MAVARPVRELTGETASFQGSGDPEILSPLEDRKRARVRARGGARGWAASGGRKAAGDEGRKCTFKYPGVYKYYYYLKLQ